MCKTAHIFKTTDSICIKINKFKVFTKLNIFHKETFKSVYFCAGYCEQKKLHNIMDISKTTDSIGTKINRTGVLAESNILQNKKPNQVIFVESIVNQRKFHES
jgi:hypothetical protein